VNLVEAQASWQSCPGFLYLNIFPSPASFLKFLQWIKSNQSAAAKQRLLARLS
jgi:hypothetical protein